MKHRWESERHKNDACNNRVNTVRGVWGYGGMGGMVSAGHYIGACAYIVTSRLQTWTVRFNL